eukprot:Trichotokara_eunicae@DN4389_c0_g1_i1.p1
MGGHGGLNILPQKKWNVYNQDNKIKVRKDERSYKERQLSSRMEEVQKSHSETLGKLRRRAEGGKDEESSDEQKADEKSQRLDVFYSEPSMEDGYEVPAELEDQQKNFRKEMDTIYGERNAQQNAQQTSQQTRTNPEAVGADGVRALFDDVVGKFEKKKEEHDDYLKEVKHDRTRKSEFSTIISQVPWYCKPKAVVMCLPKKEDVREPKGHHKRKGPPSAAELRKEMEERETKDRKRRHALNKGTR